MPIAYPPTEARAGAASEPPCPFAQTRAQSSPASNRASETDQIIPRASSISTRCRASSPAACSPRRSDSHFPSGKGRDYDLRRAVGAARDRIEENGDKGRRFPPDSRFLHLRDVTYRAGR
ncbi:hypothetical protein ACIRYZ_45120 [Kitasatospora sp. NPDC101155]|uniref:hypothetical protein n=1 Tax=Kitasatospora sp. NPDC101155 TaxID=3364097 RepID=UPI0037FB1109